MGWTGIHGNGSLMLVLPRRDRCLGCRQHQWYPRRGFVNLKGLILKWVFACLTILLERIVVLFPKLHWLNKYTILKCYQNYQGQIMINEFGESMWSAHPNLLVVCLQHVIWEIW